MLPIHGTSQSGGYHYFLKFSARQLQRFVMRRLSTDDARRNASAHENKGLHLDPAVGRRVELDRSSSYRAARPPNECIAIRGPRRTRPGARSPSTHPGPARVRIVRVDDAYRP